jgi:hypothetical protein
MLTRMIVIMRLNSVGFGVLLAYVANFAPTVWRKMAEIAISTTRSLRSFRSLWPGTLCYLLGNGHCDRLTRVSLHREAFSGSKG